MNVKKLIFLGLVLIPAALIHAQKVNMINDTSRNLSGQFEEAFSKAKSYENFWIGFYIKRHDARRILIGSYFLNDDNSNESLKDIITNHKNPGSFKSHVNTSKHIKRYGRNIWIQNGISISDKKEDRETAILFMYENNPNNIYDISDIAVCNLSRYFDLDEYPLFWLGEKNGQNSYNFLTNLFEKAKRITLKKKLLNCIGIHSNIPEVTKFLIRIINSNAMEDLRESSVFWLGFQNNEESFSEIKNVVKNDPSQEMKKNAVQSLCYMDFPGATEELIAIAKHNTDYELRKQAVYGLGNKAIIKAEEALKNIIDNDPDLEIKKHAIYALANNPDNLSCLIKIAKTNTSLSVRKSAIWNLGNSDDQRALDALIELSKN